MSNIAALAWQKAVKLVASNDDHKDLTIICEDSKGNAARYGTSRLLCASLSPVLEAMLAGEWSEGGATEVTLHLPQMGIEINH